MSEKKYYLDITTQREMTKEQWEDYKRAMLHYKADIDFKLLEKHGQYTFKDHQSGEKVETRYRLEII